LALCRLKPRDINAARHQPSLSCDLGCVEVHVHLQRSRSSYSEEHEVFFF
ncbi:hypothetical protein NDU88_005560, partial [Pleurodeles waltl]